LVSRVLYSYSTSTSEPISESYISFSGASHVYFWERFISGRRFFENPTVLVLGKLAKALGVEVEELVKNAKAKAK